MGFCMGWGGGGGGTGCQYCELYSLSAEEKGPGRRGLHPHLSQALGLTPKEVLEGLLHHFLADLRVSDGVEQMPPVGLVKYQVPQDLAIDVSILQQDLSAKSLHDAPVGGVSRLDNCGERGRLGHALEPLGQPEDPKQLEAK